MSNDPGRGHGPLADLAAAGVSVWLDDLSRQRIVTGELTKLIETKHVVGATSNPTIFAAALADANAYTDQLDVLSARPGAVGDALRAMTTEDVRRACDVFEPVWHETSGRDGRVSLEVDPGKAYDSDATASEAAELWQTVNRPNLMVKIAATPQGLPAITRSLAAGISVNVTLIFSVARYRQVIGAFLTGLEQAQASGRDLSSIDSVASFFVSRVDTEVDKRLELIATDAALQLRGTAAVANARLAYATYEEMLVERRWAALARAGASPQRPCGPRPA